LAQWKAHGIGYQCHVVPLRTPSFCNGIVRKRAGIASTSQEGRRPLETAANALVEAHPLSGDQRGRWSLTVSRNWRITFAIDDKEGEIVDLDFEDYH
jgi:proteic killer suppression protein